MRKPILAAALLAMLPLGACTSDNYGGGYGYDRPSDRRGPPRHNRRQLGDNDQIYRDRDGRYYCKRDDGTTGTIVGASAGGVVIVDEPSPIPVAVRDDLRKVKAIREAVPEEGILVDEITQMG